MNYAVGIPTCDRPEVLQRCVSAFEAQTPKPSLVVVVNHNTKGAPVPALHTLLNVKVIDSDYEVKGPEQAHQTCLNLFGGFKYAVRWDDDLIPDPACMSFLLSSFRHPWIRCVGGCYYRENSPVWDQGPFSQALPPDRNKNHLQFFRWSKDSSACVPGLAVRSLYSSFAYRVTEMLDAGGFCTEYSKLGFRGETDATLRLGGCWIEPAATALHLVAAGGVRSISDRKALEKDDDARFHLRMKNCHINLEDGLWV